MTTTQSLKIGDAVQVKFTDAPDSIAIVITSEYPSYRGIDNEHQVFPFEADQVVAYVGNVYDHGFTMTLYVAALKAAQA